MTPSPVAGPRLRVAEVLGRYPTRSPPASTAGAAVMAVLRERGGDVEVLLIERATRSGDPASGQVSLPGGHVDPSDGLLEGTALRELEEEIGLRRSDLVEPVRYVETTEAKRFSLSVGVFSAQLDDRAHVPPNGDPREVAEIFWLPHRALERPAPLVRETPQGPVELASVRHEGHVVWGFTLRVLGELFEGPRGPAPFAP